MKTEIEIPTLVRLSQLKKKLSNIGLSIIKIFQILNLSNYNLGCNILVK